MDLTSYLTDSLTSFIEAYDNYDKYGNLITLRNFHNDITIYLWSYYGKYPIAEIKGSTYNEVKSALKRKPESLSEESEPNIKNIEQLRRLLPHAQITIYDYKQQIGMKYTSQPDGKNFFFPV